MTTIPAFGSVFTIVLSLITVIAGLLYYYCISTYDYWKKRGVIHEPPTPFFGNIKDMILTRKGFCEGYLEFSNRFEGHPYVGLYVARLPALFLRDPELIKEILVKNFHHCTDRGFLIHPEKNPLQQHLFSLPGRKWRVLRTKLTPTFTSGKMKSMFPLIEQCSLNLINYLHDAAERRETIEMKDVLAKFSTDVIGTCAFGLQMNALDDPDSEFRRMGRKIFEMSAMKRFAMFTNLILPDIGRILKLDDLGAGLSDFFVRLVKETVDYRVQNNVSRNDFMQLLITLKNKGKIDDEEESEKNGTAGLEKGKEHMDFELDDGLLAAQAFVFFLAGFETSSTTMSFALHELAVHPDIQAALRAEVDDALGRSGGKLTYDAVMGMKYLDKVVSETLRMYPPVPFLRRVVTSPFTLPGTALALEKDIVLLVSTYALHHDPKHYPDPERFDPERFSEEEKAKRHHYAFLPFGEGPRNCIGMRFGLLQTKMGLASLLSKYEFHVCERTEIPIRLDPKAVVTSSTTGTVVQITKRS